MFRDFSDAAKQKLLNYVDDNSPAHPQIRGV